MTQNTEVNHVGNVPNSNIILTQSSSAVCIVSLPIFTSFVGAVRRHVTQSAARPACFIVRVPQSFK